MTPDERSASVLAQVEPAVAEKVDRVLRAMAALGHPMAAYSGLRTTEQQQALWAKGRSQPGPVVTYLDGIARRSRHQSGLAVDCAFVVSGGTPNNWGLSWDGPWECFGACAAAVGLVWGGSWKRLADKPHLELTE